MDQDRPSTRIAWFGNHEPLPRQVKALEDIYQGGVEIVRCPSTHDVQEIINDFNASGAEDLIVLAPLTLLRVLTERGIHPLFPVMRPSSPETAEWIDRGHYRRFDRFLRLENVELRLRPALPTGARAAVEQEGMAVNLPAVNGRTGKEGEG